MLSLSSLLQGAYNISGPRFALAADKHSCHNSAEGYGSKMAQLLYDELDEIHTVSFLNQTRQTNDCRCYDDDGDTVFYTDPGCVTGGK